MYNIYDFIELLMCLFVIVVVGAVYFIPSFIAFKRKHNNKIPILILNFFTGASIIGWVACLIWSFTYIKKIKE